MIYRDAKFMIDYSKKSIAAANTAMHTYDTTFCVGTSLLNPAKPFMDLWYKVNQSFPDYKLHLVPFEDNHEGILSEIEKLGEKFDFLIGVCDSKVWLSLCLSAAWEIQKNDCGIKRTSSCIEKPY